jgi:hypothetical protein
MTYEPVQYYSGMKGQKYEYGSYDSDDEDSTFGSFNPNLRTKDVSIGRASLLFQFKNGSIETPTRLNSKQGS